MWHMLVCTLSGAQYLFRWSASSGNFYASSVGSSAGTDLENVLVSPVLPKRGERMVLRIHGDMRPVRVTSLVTYWEMGRIDTLEPWATSHDNEWVVDEHGVARLDTSGIPMATAFANASPFFG